MELEFEPVVRRADMQAREVSEQAISDEDLVAGRGTLAGGLQ